jgi:hypothetical protein
VNRCTFPAQKIFPPIGFYFHQLIPKHLGVQGCQFRNFIPTFQIQSLCFEFFSRRFKMQKLTFRSNVAPKIADSLPGDFTGVKTWSQRSDIFTLSYVRRKALIPPSFLAPFFTTPTFLQPQILPTFCPGQFSHKMIWQSVCRPRWKSMKISPSNLSWFPTREINNIFSLKIE